MSMVILEIPGITGECGVKGYEGMILCESMTEDAEMEIDTSTNQRRTMHVPKVNNMQLERKMDAASGMLLRKMLTGKVDTMDWQIHCLRALGDDSTQQVEYLTIILHQPILTKYEVNVNDGDTTERLETNAVQVTFNYQYFKSDNTKAGNLSFGFNTIAGTVI